MNGENKRIVICGVGKRMRGDEMVGAVIAKDLRSETWSANVHIIDCGKAPQNQMGKIVGFRPGKVIVISAADLGKSPGSVEMMDAKAARKLLSSDHKVRLEMFMGYLQNVFHDGVSFIAIQPRTSRFGSGMSLECKNAMIIAKGMVHEMVRY